MATHRRTGPDALSWSTLAPIARQSAANDVAEHHSAGRSTYSGGTGAERGQLYEHAPDGKTYVVERRGDGYVRLHERGAAAIGIGIG